MKSLAPLIGILVIVGLIIKFIWWILGAAALGRHVLSRAVHRARRPCRPRSPAKYHAQIAARADQQHRWVLDGDDRGIYGPYPVSDTIKELRRGIELSKQPALTMANGGEGVGELHLRYLKELPGPYSMVSAEHDRYVREHAPVEPISEQEYWAGVEAAAGSCECGGRFVFDAPPLARHAVRQTSRRARPRSAMTDASIW